MGSGGGGSLENPRQGGASTQTSHTPAAVPRFVLTTSEPSRKRKLATFVAEEPVEPPQKKIQRGQQAVEAEADPTMDLVTEEPVQRRRPETKAVIDTSSSSSSKKVRIVAAVQQTDDVAQSAAFENLLAEAEKEDATHDASRHKFLPKATTRLKDRRNPNGSGLPGPRIQGEIEGDSEYVYDTYVLDEMMDIDVQSALPGSVGILHVGEEQQPIWETYLDDSDSDDQRLSDDEDSNAEDHYGADYPEDELASDDEHDVDVYQYRIGGSDEEHYGSDDAAFSDGERAKAEPWSHRGH